MTKQEEREELERHIKEFIKQGGKVQTLPAYVDQPNRPAHTNIDRRLSI